MFGRARSSARAALVRVTAGLSLSLLAAAPGVAQGDNGGKVVEMYTVAVAVDPALDGLTAGVGSAARTALRTMDGINWQQADAIYLGYEREALERLERARQRLTEGRDAYVNLELEKAVDVLTKALEDFDAAAAAVEDPEEIRDTLILLGASQLFAGNEREAERTFGRLHVQMPGRGPDPNTVPKEVIERYESAAPRQRGGGNIRVQSDPPGAIVYVDFLPRGRTPLTVRDLPPGEHVVRVVRPGSAPVVERVELRRRSTENVDAQLREGDGVEDLATALEALGSPKPVDANAPALEEVASQLKSSAIAVFRVSPGERRSVDLDLRVYDVIGAKVLAQGSRTIEPNEAELAGTVRALLEEVVSAALRGMEPESPLFVEDSRKTTGDEKVVVGPAEDDESSFWDSPVIWVAGGVILVAAAAIVLWLVTSDDDELGQDRDGEVILRF